MNKNISRILGENKNLALLCALLFLTGVAVGLSSYSILKDDVPGIMKNIFGGIMGEDSKLKITLNVISRNMQASLITLLLGVTVIIPPAIVTLNGVLVGLAVRFALQNKNMTLAKIMGGILPHAVFELPAFFIAAAVGMKVGLKLVSPGKEKRVTAVASKIKEAAFTYITIIIPLVILSAVIEVFISAPLAGP